MSQFLGVIGAVGAFFFLRSFLNTDFAILISRILLMILGRLSYRIPLVLAIMGLLGLMGLSLVEQEGDVWDEASDVLAVGVFFALVIGVVKMVFDEIIGLSERETEPFMANEPAVEVVRTRAAHHKEVSSSTKPASRAPKSSKPSTKPASSSAAPKSKPKATGSSRKHSVKPAPRKTKQPVKHEVTVLTKPVKPQAKRTKPKKPRRLIQG